jgi:transcriptional regulator with PAS, ATPase and Fis domain
MSQSSVTAQGIPASIQPKPTDETDYLAYVNDKKAQDSLLTFDPKMQHVRNIVEQIKDANVPVLISGESGTGKELIAKLIHSQSSRKDKPFVAINCAALPTNLLESELFGYEKGAFTGAHQRHQGKFEQASGGTLLLDEVTEMDIGLQAKLLRALQEREVQRLGGTGTISVDTRIIATTNRDITTLVSKNLFRQDLYYRLYVIHIEVPALRERTLDVTFLAEHFLRKFAEQFGKHGLRFSQDAMQKLRAHSWPGNVRELQNIIQRSVLLANGEVITANDVPLVQAEPTNEAWIKSLPIGKQLRDVETQFILETLKTHAGNRTHAAKTLGISLRTLRNKINEFTAEGIEVIGPSTGKAL